jgi:hypothetical protein
MFSFRYNGQIPNGDRGRRKSKFQLRQRIQANGLKAQRQHLCKNADEVQVWKNSISIPYLSQGHSSFEIACRHGDRRRKKRCI